MDDLTQDFIAESWEGLERMERCLAEFERKPGDTELVAEIFRIVHTIKGATGFLGFDRLQRLAHAGEELLALLRDGRIAAETELVTALLDTVDRMRAVLRLIEVSGAEGVRARDDDEELLARLEAFPLHRQHVLEERRDPQTQTPALPVAHAAPLSDRTVRVDVEILNRIMNLVGELVVTRNRIVRSLPGAEGLQELSRRLDRVTAELRTSVMQARMQPVGTLFGKLTRLTRELARTCGKQVRVEFSGQDTGLDKSLLEAVRDPLTHALRNAVGHGIESAEQRVAAGKAPEGVVRVRAFQQDGTIVLEVEDDGAGMATQQLVAKAIEQGLIAPESARTMTETEALHLIFLPGFSTASVVTSVSGRGVGMDVVRTSVEKVGGSVEVESRPGEGTTVRMRMPLTLALVPALLVQACGETFALPQVSLVELIHVADADRLSAVEQLGSVDLYRFRGRMLPLVRLERVLGLQPASALAGQGVYLAVVAAENGHFGLIVEGVAAPEEIIAKPLPDALRECGVFSGATVLADGSLAMILDVQGLAEHSRKPPASLPRTGDIAPGALGGDLLLEVA